MSDKLAQWIEHELDERGWSIRELARRAQLSPSTIGDILNENTQPGLKFYRGLARAFGVPLVVVLQKAGEGPPIPAQTANWLRLSEMWEQLSTEDQERVLAIVEALVRREQ